MPVAEMSQMGYILDKRVSKRTRRKQCFEYLVKWKNNPVEDANWETEAEIQKHGQTVQELMDNEPMKFFKRGSMMQEHHQHIKRASAGKKTPGQAPTQILKVS
jgi:hypothetical protein